MKLVKLSELFDVQYGVNLELNSLKLNDSGINFASRTAKNNGISAKVQKIEGVKALIAGGLSVAGGGSVLETFLQPEPFYSGRDLYVLTPRGEMTDAVKLYYCACIRANKYRYSYGRQANRTLKDIEIPALTEIPTWVHKANSQQFDHAPASVISNPSTLNLDINNWIDFKYNDLFDISRGKGPRRKDLDGEGNTPFITSSDSNNGLTGFTSNTPTHNGNTIGVNRNGSVAEAFYQPVAFCSTEDVHIFSPKDWWQEQMNAYVGQFLCTLIKKEKYRFSYGRKWGIERMKETTIKLPVTPEGLPDWDFMSNYIKSLPFSSQI